MTTGVTVVTGTVEGFDYAALDMETRVVVQQRTGEIRSLVRRSAQDIIEIGLKLGEVKGRIGHGGFGRWLDAEFQWSQDTAGRFMQVAQRFGQIPQIADFAPSALYLLAAASTPDEAVEEALERAEGGERITHATAKAIVDEYRPAPASSNGGLAVGSPEARRLGAEIKAATWGDRNAPAADAEKQRATWGDLTAIVREVAEAKPTTIAVMRQAADVRSPQHRNKFYYDVLNAVRGRYYNRFDLADMCMAISTVADQMEAAQPHAADALTAPDDLAGRWELQQSAAGFRMSDGYILTQPCATAEGAFELARRIEDEEARSEEAEENVAPQLELDGSVAEPDDPWVAAVALSGSRQSRVEALAQAITPWIERYEDEYGRDWHDLVHGNVAHTNSTLWRHITAEARRRGATIKDELFKDAIKQAFSWLAATDEPVEEPDTEYIERLADIIVRYVGTRFESKDAALRFVINRSDYSLGTFAQSASAQGVMCNRQQLLQAIDMAIPLVMRGKGSPSDNPLLSDGDEVKIEEPSIDEDEEEDEEELPPVDEAYTGQPVGEESTPVSMRDGYDSDEWYTPAWVIEAARQVMGEIDLDPASCELAQEVVQAGLFWSKRQNGALMGWFGRVWLNPPYSEPKAFVDKLLAEYAHGNVRQAVVLLNNATETAWFQAMLARFPVCFFSRRLAFWRHDHADVGARQGQAVFYLGQDVERFCEVFGQFGIVVKRLD